MENEISDLVVDKDVKCPLCGGEMKKYRSVKGKTEFCCVVCGYKI
jgi:transposase-like protein